MDYSEPLCVGCNTRFLRFLPMITEDYLNLINFLKKTWNKATF